MLLVTYIESGREKIGVLDRARQEIADLSAIADSMQAFIAAGASALTQAQRTLALAKRVSLANARLRAPIPKPARNILCVGKNYREHAREVQATAVANADKDGVPEVPLIFTKWTSSVIGPGEPIPSYLDSTQSTDYEGELAVVIGPGGRGIARADAMRHVYGYTIVNDVTSRRLQKLHNQWFIGKSIDGFCPMGPAILTADEIADVGQLRVRTLVNGDARQDAPVSDLVFDIPTLIETLSRTMTLEPGDIIATGTPAGVGMGFKPPKFLQPGDIVSVTIDPIGTLENPVA